MDIFNAGMKPYLAKRLARREAELRHLLQATNEQLHEAAETGPRGVVDFKDAAAEQSLAVVDAAKAEHALRELDEVVAAFRRLADHSYGLCADCGEAIDLGRLMALAATPCCTTCQAIREQRHTASPGSARNVVA